MKRIDSVEMTSMTTFGWKIFVWRTDVKPGSFLLLHSGRGVCCVRVSVLLPDVLMDEYPLRSNMLCGP